MSDVPSGVSFSSWPTLNGESAKRDTAFRLVLRWSRLQGLTTEEAWRSRGEAEMKSTTIWRCARLVR